jgi:hypothetical protein
MYAAAAPQQVARAVAGYEKSHYEVLSKQSHLVTAPAVTASSAALRA